MKEDLHDFSADRPIQSVEDDLLGRAGFSSDLAEALASWHGKDSLVVALHGEWGSGKSSIKNMALSELKKISNNSLGVVEFSPWEWAAQEKITESFFHEVSVSIGASSDNKKNKEFAAKFKLYGQYLNTGEIVATGISSSLPIFLLVVVAAIGAGSDWFDETLARNIQLIAMGIIAAGIALLRWGQSLLNSVSKCFSFRTLSNERGLHDLRRELTDILSQRKSPLIIVMDDLDRLTREQLRMVFQLVKANSDFPNVVFVLLFQRDLVEEKLSEESQHGRAYLEKIIQVPFDIPKVEISRVHNVLFKRLDKLLSESESASEMFDETYWGNLFHSSIKHYLNNLRDVYRYMSTLSFHFSMLNGRGVFEVNPVDLFGVECLRVFEPDVYKQLSMEKEVFTSVRPSYDSLDEKHKSIILSVIERASDGKEDVVRDLLQTLFPTIRWALGGTSYSGSFSGGWLRDMRVCHSSNFNKFFQFTIPDGELSNSDLKKMLNLTSDANGFEKFVWSFEGKGLLKNALSQFEAYSEKIPVKNAKEYILALLNLGDKVDDERDGRTFFSPLTHLVRLLIQFWEKFDTPEERGRILQICFEKSTALCVVEHVLQSDENSRERGEDTYLDDMVFNELKEGFVSRLDELALNSSEELIFHNHLVSFLYRWTRWGDEKKILSWLSDKTSVPANGLQVLKGFVRKVSSHGMGDYVARVQSKITLSEVEKFLNVDRLKRTLDKIDNSKLNNEDKEALAAFYEALERRDKGIIERW